MTKVALVLPPAEKVAEKKDTPAYQHVGLGYLASMLEESGIETTVINAKLGRMDLDDTVKSVIESSPAILGITAMTHEINMANMLAERVKASAPETVVVIGGVHVTALPRETLKQFPAFDIGIIGEGEYSFLGVVRLIEKDIRSFPRLKGVVYRSGPEILISEPSERITDLDKLPFPAWNRFPKATEYIIITSRGCPFSCIFCMRALGQQVRKRSASNVVEEIERVLKERKPSRFLFYDETFTLDKERVYEICDLIIRKGINKRIRWSATTRVDNIDRDVLLKIKEAGCDHIEFGVESGDEEMLRRIKKSITLSQAEKAVGLARDMGFHTETAFILGHPNETLKSAYHTIYFASKLNADIAQLGIMVPYPGTEVARLAREGLGGYKVISDNWSDYNKQLGNALELETLSRLDLERLQLAGYLKLFVANKRFIGLARFIWNFRREMISFLRNHFNKDKPHRASSISLRMVIKMILKNSPEPV